MGHTSAAPAAGSRSAARFPKRLLLPGLLLLCWLAPATAAQEPGLLFHLSADRGFTADFARGGAEPNFLKDVALVADGVVGSALRCEHTQVLSYPAPGNIFAQRGTLSFFWRAREPLGSAPFPIFRVGYADHSSWDMVWLRIDYNGHGFDAFVTDANLARTRVSYRALRLPRADQWVHLALSWDETQGIRLYVDGAEAARRDTAAVFDAGLDQFGPHSRIISPYQVQSAYNFMRGGDVDEIRIYDRMLGAGDVARLARAQLPSPAPLARPLSDPRWRQEWWLRFGWNRPGDAPPYLAAPATTIRRVEFTDARDLKQWYWKGNDGIRETTWPGVYNRSRIPGRNDYFQLPDWNVYSGSGQAVTFSLPGEPWNHLEIQGAAHGSLSFAADSESDAPGTRLAARVPDQERTWHRLAAPLRGGRLRFENAVQETPIGEIAAYHVGEGREPAGVAKLSYTLRAGVAPDNPSLVELVRHIHGRHVPDERSAVVALPEGAPAPRPAQDIPGALPLVHVLIPADFRETRPGEPLDRFSYTWENLNGGLDGIAIDLPALEVRPTHGEVFPLNIQVRDPIWAGRVLLDVSVSVKPGEARTLWLDTRDRILPNGHSLYLTIAGAGADFGPRSLDGARVRLVFGERSAAAREQAADRFEQIRDNYGFLVEEHPNKKRLRLYDRFHRDITDLLRADPDHLPGRYYWSDNNPEQGWPAFTQPEPPAGVPLWAFRQTESLKLLGRFIRWWMDERQIENGEFGGGLSDDGDLTNQWPALALMGVDPDRVTRSVTTMLEEFYHSGMFTDGLSTILTDELHSYEEGIQVLPQAMLLDYGDPKVVERMMETARAYERITEVNAAGHRHIVSNLFSGSRVVREGVWEWSKPSSYLILHPGIALVDFNGHPELKRLLLELADGYLAHRKRNPDGTHTYPAEINWRTDQERGAGVGRAINLFWAAYRWTGDRRYLQPLQDDLARGDLGQVGFLNSSLVDQPEWRDGAAPRILAGVTPESGSDFARHSAWQLTGDKRFLEGYYADQIRSGSQRMYMMTEGHWWSDRVEIPSAELQRSRLGGVALLRNRIVPGHLVSWRFHEPASGEDVALLVDRSTPRGFRVIAFNLTEHPVSTTMTAWDVAPGRWRMASGTDTDGDDVADAERRERSLVLERGQGVELEIAPLRTMVFELTLDSASAPVWQRPDLAIGAGDVRREGNDLLVTVHSLGSVAAPAASLALRDASGREVARAAIPGLEAPAELRPRTVEIRLPLPAGFRSAGHLAVVDPDDRVAEITEGNNSAPVP